MHDAGTSQRAFHHDDWNALLGRFVLNGNVDYPTFARVIRLVEAYLDRLANARPDTWADPDAHLALYLNAYNAIAVYQILLNWPVASLTEIPGFFTRPFPVGRRNVALDHLRHGAVRRYRDPSIHLALAPGTIGWPRLQPFAFSATAVRDQLTTARAAFLHDQEHAIRFDAAGNTLYLASLFRWYAGDWSNGRPLPRAARLLGGLVAPASMVPALLPLLPPAIQHQIADRHPHVRWIPDSPMLAGIQP
ncbi:MAG: hypothetical protein NVS2B7_30580 [Herpetosiphon sp.]